MSNARTLKYATSHVLHCCDLSGALQKSPRYPKEPWISAKEPYIFSNEPYYLQKSPKYPQRDLSIRESALDIRKEAYQSAKETHLSAKEPSMCDSLKCESYVALILHVLNERPIPPQTTSLYPKKTSICPKRA